MLLKCLMGNGLSQSTSYIRMIVVEPFEAAGETEHLSMWFTPGLEILMKLDSPDNEVVFTFDDRCFTSTREIIAAHCRPYCPALAASQ